MQPPGLPAPRHLREPCAGDPRCGCAPRERPLREYVSWGVVILDKPAGTTSRMAADRVRRALGARKVGHGGTLDPMVTGVLPVLLGRATPVAAVLLGCDKAYRGVMRLHGDVSDDELADALEAFRGRIRQTPPRRSRVKRVERERTVYAFDVTDRQGREAAFCVECAGGTYVRKLVHDLGVRLGCGAHMASLVRTRAGPFALEEAVSARQVEEAARRAADGEEAPLRGLVRPAEEVLGRVLPQVRMDDGAVDNVCHGAELAVPGVCALDDFGRGDPVVLLTLKGELVALGTALMDCGEVLSRQHGLAFALKRVFMAPGTYPRGPGRAGGAGGGGPASR